MMENVRIDHIGTGGPVFLLCAHRDSDNTELLNEIRKLCPNAAFTLASFGAEEWNRDYSPWEAPTADGKCFGGGGKETLQRLKEACKGFSGQEIYLVGYSLAGLFALWSLYECEDFSGAACCSGSLWMDGWEEYAKSHALSHPCKVYLSLGGTEERTDNPLLSKVGNRTRMQEKLLKYDKNALTVTLEMNSGGHFANHNKRLAKGIAWLLHQNKREETHGI